MAPRLATQQAEALPSKSTTSWDAYLHQSGKAGKWWFVWVQRAELLRACYAQRRGRRAIEARSRPA
jgi:hypothetical protein